MQIDGRAYFVERPRRLEDLQIPHLIDRERPYRIVATVELRKIDYENFITDMLADRQFIEDQGQDCKAGDVWDCLLVRQRNRTGGVLVLPEQDCFVSWAAYVPEADI
ncbi:MAG: hypothetical protein IJ221_08270 [Oscillibacter sp.]|nr:hypothetical protein [Oscillibacter sp.]